MEPPSSTSVTDRIAEILTRHAPSEVLAGLAAATRSSVPEIADAVTRTGAVVEKLEARRAQG